MAFCGRREKNSVGEGYICDFQYTHVQKRKELAKLTRSNVF
jgi:hypothetical protein